MRANPHFLFIYCLCIIMSNVLHVHLNEIFRQAFGGVGKGRLIPIFDQKHEVFYHGIDFQRFWQIFGRDEVVFNASGGKLVEFGAQIGQKYVLALRKQYGVQQHALVVQMIEYVRDEMLVVKHRRF